MTRHHYKKLKADSPSVIRMTLFSWLMRIVFFILAAACIILGVALLISESAGEQLLNFVKGTEQANGLTELDRHIYNILAFLFIALGILFYLVSFLSARLVIRGTYIIGLEALLEETMEKKEALEKAARQTAAAKKKDEGQENKE